MLSKKLSEIFMFKSFFNYVPNLKNIFLRWWVLHTHTHRYTYNEIFKQSERKAYIKGKK